MKAWCPTCRTADYADERYRCLWCGTVTLGVLNRKRASPSRCIPEEALRSAHERYAAGENASGLARALRTHRNELLEHWWALGLPTRDLAASNRLESQRRSRTGVSGTRNHFYRHDLDDGEILAAYGETRNMQRTAEIVRCSLSTVSRRLARAKR